MGKPELGTKCLCTGCGERFYDLNKSPAICPKCGVQHLPEMARVSRPPRSPFGTRFRSSPRVAVVAEEDAGPVDTSDAESEDEKLEEEDEIDDDIEADPDLAKPDE